MKENHVPIMAAVILTTRVLGEVNQQLGAAEKLASEDTNGHRASAVIIDILCCQEALSRLITLVDETLAQIQSESDTHTVEEFINELQNMKAEPNPLVEPFMVYNLSNQYNKIMDDLVEELSKSLNR